MTAIKTVLVWLVLCASCWGQMTMAELQELIDAADKTIFARDPQLNERGAQHYRLGTHAWWFARRDGIYDLSKVDVPTIDRYMGMFGSEDSMLLVDIEAWRLDRADEFSDGMPQIQIALQRWRDKASHRKIGFYTSTVRNYWTPVNYARALRREDGYDLVDWRQRYRNWQAQNDRLAEGLRGLIDYHCVSIYAFYHGYQSRWIEYAEANIAEAVRTSNGQPIYVIVQPNYPNGDPIELGKWSMMMDYLKSHPDVDGIIIFTRDHFPAADGWRDHVMPAPEVDLD